LEAHLQHSLVSLVLHPLVEEVSISSLKCIIYADTKLQHLHQVSHRSQDRIFHQDHLHRVSLLQEDEVKFEEKRSRENLERRRDAGKSSTVSALKGVRLLHTKKFAICSIKSDNTIQRNFIVRL